MQAFVLIDEKHIMKPTLSIVGVQSVVSAGWVPSNVDGWTDL